MAHVELSLTESFVPHARHAEEPGLGPSEDSLRRWAGTAASANEASLVIAASGVIVAASASCCELLGLGDPRSAMGRYLLDEVRLIDFTAAQGELTEPEIANIPPLLALSSGRLARGLLRVQCPDQPNTVDAISTPLLEDDRVVGSLTFFARV